MPLIELPPPDQIASPTDFFPLWVAMYYPHDEKGRIAFLELSQREAEYPGREPSSVWKSAFESVSKPHRQGHVAGNVAIALIQLYRWHRRASISKASLIISEHFYHPESLTRKGKRYPADPRDVRRAFYRFKNSVHIWAAWNAVTEKEHQKIIEGDINYLRLLTNFSGIFEEMLRETGRMGDWTPHQIPKSWYDPSLRLVIDKLEPWAVDLLNGAAKTGGT